MTVSYSRFPASVTTSDGTVVNRAAVVVVDGRAELAVQPPRSHTEPDRILVLATLDDVTVEPQTRREVTLRAADGQTWQVGVGDGCGCRSSLSEWFRNRLKGQALGT